MKPVVIAEGVTLSPPLLPCASIEISEAVTKKLYQICVEQNIPIKDLVSTLLQRMLLEHRKETKQIAEKFKCRDF
jgi:hypothetical protein